MKTKTKKKLNRIAFYGLVALFVASTVLIYLPIISGTPANQSTAPALNGLPPGQNGQSDINNLPPEVQAQLRQQQAQAGGQPADPSGGLNVAPAPQDTSGLQPNGAVPAASNGGLQGAPAQ